MWSAFSSCKIKSFALNSETGIETRDPEGPLGSLFGFRRCRRPTSTQYIPYGGGGRGVGRARLKKSTSVFHGQEKKLIDWSMVMEMPCTMTPRSAPKQIQRLPL